MYLLQPSGHQANVDRGSRQAARRSGGSTTHCRQRISGAAISSDFERVHARPSISGRFRVGTKETLTPSVRQGRDLPELVASALRSVPRGRVRSTFG